MYMYITNPMRACSKMLQLLGQLHAITLFIRDVVFRSIISQSLVSVRELYFTLMIFRAIDK